MRIGFVQYINTAPIMIPWRESGPLSGWESVEATPSELNRLLHVGEIDTGMISSFEYGLHPDSYHLLPELCISSTGAVKSVILLSRIPAGELGGKIVSLTPQSATSVALLRILLEDFFNVRPLYQAGSSEDLAVGTSDAYLAIGDEALRLARNKREFLVTDLAEIWLQKTGLPFVFAVWAVRNEVLEKAPYAVDALRERLISCVRTGQREIVRIASIVAPQVYLTPASCLSYLEGIEYDFSSQKRRGLLEFFRRLSDRGEIPPAMDLRLIPRSFYEVTE